MATGAGSNASTVPGSDDAAIENARVGCEQARQQEAATSAAAAANAEPKALPARPGILRVNSVPVFSPHTPSDKIRRTNTPPVSLEPTTSSESPSTAETNRSGCESPPSQPPVPEASTLPRKKKVIKRIVKRKQSTGTNGRLSMKSTAPHEKHDDDHQEPAEPIKTVHPESQQPVTHGSEEGKAKPAAKKAAAKPPSPPEPSLEPVKAQEQTPARTAELDDAARQQAAKDSLTRASTDSQLPTTPEASHDDLEQQLDREIKKELPMEQSNNLQPQVPPAQPGGMVAVTVAQPVPHRPEQPAAAPDSGTQQEQPQTQPSEPTPTLPKRRREKTPAEKAAHARYMKFSRSFNRFSAFGVVASVLCEWLLIQS